jgi:di/tricarboxylate transporter
MMLLNVADSKASVKGMPWFVILMVCGVTVLIEVMERSGGLAAMSSIIAAASGPTTVNFWLGLVTGVISAYSSSSGVVMPAFLPLVPGLLKLVPGADAIAMISSINIGAHLVDTSPLSTLGALCIACADESEDKAKLFRNLLIWGLSMSIVGAIVCWVAFGILGI